MELLVKKLHQFAQVPLRKLEAEGFDLHAVEEVLIAPLSRAVVSLGIATAFTPGWAGLMIDRSGMGMKGIHIFGGLIDSGYRGEWKVILYNSTPEPFKVVGPKWTHELGLIEPGVRITQVIFIQVYTGEPQLVDELPESLRGEAGFGSTDLFPHLQNPRIDYDLADLGPEKKGM